MRPRIVALVGVAFIAGLAEAVALMLTVRVVLLLTQNEPDGTISLLVADASSTTALALAAGLSVVAAILHFIIAKYSGALIADAMYSARQQIAEQYLHASWATQAREREGALQEAATTLASRIAAVVQAVAIGATQLAVLVTFAVIALIVDPVATLLVIAAGFLLLFVVRPMARRTRELSTRFVAENSRFAEDVSRLTSNALEIRAFGVTAEAEAELRSQAERARRLNRQSRAATLYGASLFKDLALLLLIGFAAVAVAVVDGSFDGLGVVLTLVVRSIASAQQVNAAYQQFSEYSPAVTAFGEQIDRLRAGSDNDGDQTCDTIETLEFDDVSYDYGAGTLALRNVSLRLERGEALGVVGASGGGKSTIVQVMLRLRRPTSGIVRVNGRDATELTSRSLAQQIGFVPQEPALLEASIADNIAFYRRIDHESLVDAARRANILDAIDAMPNGFETLLGPRGLGLSGGQKQRLAIARALAGSPSLLVLDEPSSALDSQSEALLAETLDDLKGETALVIIAHRPATLATCDRFLIVRGGKVANVGSLEAALDRAEPDSWRTDEP